MATRHLTILLTDIKGFTDKTSHQTRAQIIDMLERHKSVVQPVLEGRGGRLVKTIGDAYLMAFDSPTDAVLAGIAVQDALRQHNEGRPAVERIDVRIAINCGEVTLADNDVFGEPVNITARIEAVAEAGEVFFTEAVYLSMNKAEVPSAEVGLLQLKGIPEKIRVYKVKRETPLGQNAALPASGTGLRDASPKAVFAAAGAAAAAVATAASKTVQAARAPAASGGAKPAIWRRLGALAIDAMLCAMIINALAPGRDRVNIHKKAGRPAEVTFTHDGVKVDAKDANVNISPSGLKITPNGKSADADDEERHDGAAFLSMSRFGFPLAWFIYSLFCLKRFGTTLGGRAFRLAVVRMDGLPLEKGDRMMRAGMSLVSMWTLGLGFYWALWEKDGRGWHDLMAGTRVVELDR